MIDSSIFKVKGLISTYLGLICLIVYTWLPQDNEAITYSLLIFGSASFIHGVYTGFRFELFAKKKAHIQKVVK